MANGKNTDKTRKREALFTEMIKDQPDDACLYCIRGVEYNRLREFGRAMNDFTEVIRIGMAKGNDICPKIYRKRAAVLENMGRYDDAIIDYTNGINMRGDGGTIMNRAMCYLKIGRYAESVKDLEKAVELLSTNNILRIPTRKLVKNANIIIEGLKEEIGET